MFAMAARSTWKYSFIMAIVITAGLVGIFATGSSASAKGPSEHASCMGQEAAAISPPGSSEEVPGGMPEFMQFIRGLPGSPGSTISFIAHLHEGSHEACDAASRDRTCARCPAKPGTKRAITSHIEDHAALSAAAGIMPPTFPARSTRAQALSRSGRHRTDQ